MNQLSVDHSNTVGEKQRAFSPITRRHFQAMLIVMVLTLGYATYQTQFGSPNVDVNSLTIQKTTLKISDASNGDILITVLDDEQTSIQEKTHKVIRFSGEQGFLRGTLRALARERRMRNLTAEAPFELALFQDGRLSITDTLTNKGIDIEAFGPDNVAVFMKVLTESVKN